MDKRPIGVFDSGFGGLTVLKAIKERLPNEDLIYFGDNGRNPYGIKSKEIIEKYTIEDISFLLTKDVKLIVIACNTASAIGYSKIKGDYDIPIIEVIKPGSKRAKKVTKNKKVGVIGTEATISSGIYASTIKELDVNIEVIEKACTLFVPLVEAGWTDNEVAKLVVAEYLKELKDKEIDALLLGCTHYPLIYDTIKEYMGESVELINSASEIAKEVEKAIYDLKIYKQNGKGSIEYYTSDSKEKFETIGSVFMREKIKGAIKIDIEKYGK